MSVELTASVKTIEELGLIVRQNVPPEILNKIDIVVKLQQLGRLSKEGAEKEINNICHSCSPRQRVYLDHYVRYHPPSCQYPERITVQMFIPQ